MTRRPAFQWTGVMPAMTTPFDSNGEVDIDAAAEHAQWMFVEGCNGVVVGGSLGEGQALTLTEKRQLWTAISAALGTKAPTIAAIGAASTREACALAAAAAECGCAGLMVLPPYVHCGNEREALRHIEVVAAQTPLPVMVYNNPAAYRADLSARSLASLATRQSNIKAVKESTGNPKRIGEIAELVRRGEAPSDLALFVGLDDIVPAGVAAGASGWIAGLANALPSESVALWKLAVSQPSAPLVLDFDRAFLPLLRMDTLPDFVQRIKHIQSLVGGGSDRVRAPLLELGESQRGECAAALRTALELFERLGVRRSSRIARALGGRAR